MSEQQPGLSVFLPVAGIQEVDLIEVREQLVSRGIADEADLEKMFCPAAELRATLINSGELQALSRKGLVRGLDAEAFREMGRLIIYDLAGKTGELGPVPTLPSKVQSPFNRPARKALTIAGSEGVLAKRRVAQNAVCKFLGRNSMPRGAWFNDIYTSEVHIARGHNQRRAEVVKDLKRLLNNNEIAFPESVQLQPVEMQVFGAD